MSREKFFCKDCNKYFFNPKYYYEQHGLDTPPYERVAVCPVCGGDDFIEFESLVDKVEVAQKLLPAIMMLNKFSNEITCSDTSALNEAIASIVELVCEMFEFFDYEMQNKVAMVDNELELEEILMFLDGEL